MTGLVLIGLPFLLAAADHVEKPLRRIQQEETFSTEVFIEASPETVWTFLAKMPEMQGKQPFLLWAGLPVPDSCVLDKEAVGGRRVCHFDQGIIAQEVTGWRQPELMTTRVVENTLPGRRWLTFVDARYDLARHGKGTVLTRKTTIASRLYPRWYWRHFEQWGVTSEHDYVLSNLKRWAEEK